MSNYRRSIWTSFFAMGLCDVTHILEAIQRVEGQAAEQLLPLV